MPPADPARLRDILDRFEQVRVMVIGDVYLDENVYGVMTGVSLEAPIPILEVRERRHNPGAAGNAACNAAALGAKTLMVGVVGDDANAEAVRKGFTARGVDVSRLLVDPERPTNTYGKLRAGGHHIPLQEVLRTDTPAPPFIGRAVEDKIIDTIRACAPEVDAVMVVDQVASVATHRVLGEVAACAKKHNILTIGDSRSRANAFEGFDVVVPNDREAGFAAGINVVDDASLSEAAQALLRACKTVMVTRGARGITVFTEDGTIEDVPVAPPGKVVDVTGAGDTVTATVAVSLAAGASVRDAAELANAAAGIAVTKHGVVTVSREELDAALFGKSGSSKVKTFDELAAACEELREQGKTVVWTNGCFDILHVGHITYLQRAAAQGDVLVVGLNSDESVSKVKGPDRPIIHEAERALVLSALECVDYIIIFGEPTTVSHLEALKPDVYAKGGDYTLETIVQEERRVVEGYGGAIAIIPGVEGRSTTNIIDRIAPGK